jgi:hypothetical protein
VGATINGGGGAMDNGTYPNLSEARASSMFASFELHKIPLITPGRPYLLAKFTFIQTKNPSFVCELAPRFSISSSQSE